MQGVPLGLPDGRRRGCSVADWPCLRGRRGIGGRFSRARCDPLGVRALLIGPGPAESPL